MHSHEYFPLSIAEVIAETDSAVSIVLEIPDHLVEDFRYKSGQFLTFRLPVDGQFRHRCYSLSSSPSTDAKHKVTVKRVDRGLVSNMMCSELRAGDTLLVQPPAGHFVPPSFDGDFLMFAGGSGVTPILSILKSALCEGTGRVVVLYANRDEKSVIFRDELIKIAAAYSGRLTVLHWLETVQGLPHSAQIAALVRPWIEAEIFICGPEPFMAAVSQALSDLGADDRRIHVERFVSLPDEVAPDIAAPISGAADAALSVTIDGKRHDVAWPRNAKMLDTMLAAGLDAPYSCRVGGCSACMCKLLKGDVRMAANLALDEHDLAEGWVLACQSFPISDDVEVEIPS